MQVCTRCVFRFLNIRNVDFAGLLPSPSSLLSKLKHSKTNGEAETSAVDAPAVEDMKDPCLVCLGALHMSVVDAGALQQIEEVVRKDGYSFDEFCLEVSVPAIAIVRERSLW